LVGRHGNRSRYETASAGGCQDTEPLAGWQSPAPPNGQFAEMICRRRAFRYEEIGLPRDGRRAFATRCGLSFGPPTFSTGAFNMRSTQARPVLAIALGAAVALGVVGCGGGYKNFTPEDFKKVEKGMSEDKVKEILGSPFDSAQFKDVKRLWWRVDDKYYSASLKDGKVVEPMGPTDKKDYEMMKALMQLAQ
jgi:hypothetical protein